MLPDENGRFKKKSPAEIIYPLFFYGIADEGHLKVNLM